MASNLHGTATEALHLMLTPPSEKKTCLELGTNAVKLAMYVLNYTCANKMGDIMTRSHPVVTEVPFRFPSSSF